MAAPEVARFRRRARLALFDATTLTARGVKDRLAARSFPSASIRLFTSKNDPDFNLTEVAGEPVVMTNPDFETLGDLDVAFLCGTRAEGETYLDWAERGGFFAVDLTGASAGAPSIPLVNAGVNPDALPAKPGVIASPSAAAQMLSSLLAPVRRRCGLREAVIVVLRPASERGQAGIDELYQQALSLMNFQEMPKEVFGRQLAFNLVPAWPAEGAKKPDSARAELERQVLRVTGGGYGLSVQVIDAPVFHGHAVMAHLVLREGTGAGDVLAAFEGTDDVRIGRPGDKVTPVERAGDGELLVTGVQPGLQPSAFWVWSVSDDLAGGRSRNAVRIAEAILERAPGSVRT
jgi:aspartate-semialdehyde dehydrogenase